MVLDGVYRCGADGLPTFIEATSLTDDELHALLQDSYHPPCEGAHAPGRTDRGDGADLPGRAGCRRCPCEVEIAQAGPGRISWARLLKRVFDIDMQHCPNCGLASSRSSRHAPASGKSHAGRGATFLALSEYLNYGTFGFLGCRRKQSLLSDCSWPVAAVGEPRV